MAPGLMGSSPHLLQPGDRSTAADRQLMDSPGRQEALESVLPGRLADALKGSER